MDRPQLQGGARFDVAPGMTIPSESAPAGSPDKAFRRGEIWRFIARPIAANQRVAGQRKPARSSPGRGPPSLCVARARRPAEIFGNFWKSLEIFGNLWKSLEVF